MAADLAEVFSGMTDALAGEQSRQFDAQIGVQKRQIDNQYKIAKLQAKTQHERNEIDKWYNEQQINLAQMKLTEDIRQFNENLGWSKEQFGKTFPEQQRQFNENLGWQKEQFGQTFPEQQRQYNLSLAETQAQRAQQQEQFGATLGYNLLGQAAQLRGPSDYFQAADYARGVANQPETSTFLTALKKNARLSDYGQQYGQPTPETLNSMMGKLQNGVGAGPNNYLAQIYDIGTRGAHQLGPGSLEQLTPDELNLFKSGLDKLGFSSDTFLSQYNKSRIGNTFSTAA